MSEFKRLTESPSNHRHLETLATADLVRKMNEEDRTVAEAVAAALPQIEALIDQTVLRMQRGGRLVYVGAGTSGRLGVLDASECPPTFGVSPDLVVGLIAGGPVALTSAVESAEDSTDQARKDLEEISLNADDIVVGLAASGSTPYVIGAIEYAKRIGAGAGCVTCNPGSPLAAAAPFPVEVITGPEFVTGSTRLKAGTAEKLVLNMLTTCTFIKLGHVKDNRMVDMKLSNEKLVDRGSRMIMEATGLDYDAARALLLKHGSVRAASALRNPEGG
ncbi:MAG: N-acetylmuramic acid 6-phosphate etherase [Saprospiraceae bacterium]